MLPFKISHIIFTIFESHINLKIVYCSSCKQYKDLFWNIVSNNFYYRNLLVLGNQDGIYNRLSHIKTRYWVTILYYTLAQIIYFEILQMATLFYMHCATGAGGNFQHHDRWFFCVLDPTTFACYLSCCKIRQKLDFFLASYSNMIALLLLWNVAICMQKNIFAIH
jgi:hypothetical protein